MKDIDIVVAWVDGNDPLWKKEKEQYDIVHNPKSDSSDARYRDWDVFKYWFRGIETFAPWVRKIHFVTWGHLPEWLNVDNEKLHVVNHRDFIPGKYLPTFSANPIELNLHRIPGLSEKFIYFNDDMFLIKKTSYDDFFKNGKPCDSAILCPHCYSEKEMMVFTPFVDIGVINKYFNIKEVINKNKKQWFNVKYGKFLFSNIFLYYSPKFPGMYQQHLPTSFLKETFEKVWNLENEALSETCSHKFREKLDLNQWMLKEWQIAEGNFYPRSIYVGKSFVFKLDKTEIICDYIENQKGLMVCLNDITSSESEFVAYANDIRNSFQKILPEKSSYEK